MQTPLVKSILYAGLLCAGLGGNALVMPLGAMPAVSSPPVTQVDYACGRGWHLNDWNECVRNRWRPPPPPPPPWAHRGWGPRYGAWGDGPRGHWHHRRPPPPPDWY